MVFRTRFMPVLLCVVTTVLRMWNYASAAKTVHVVFGSHQDIGFNNIEPEIGWDNNVINKYFNEFFPRAVDIADQVKRLSPNGDSYIYTTSSWMLSMFLDCPPVMGLNCPNATTRETVLRGMESGAITYHAHPTKAQLEFYDASLLDFSHTLTHDLDMRFGLKPKNTVVLRDVPGITRAAIPFLAARGIRGLSVGVNQASAPPGVPWFTPFIWRDEASGTQVIAFWRPGGYGGWYRDMILDPPQECIQAPGLDHVLCTSWRWDNMGPATDASEVVKMFDVIRQDWTDSSSDSSSDGRVNVSAVKVVASTFDAFVDAVWEALPTLNLTVFTGEIGDSWIWGVQSDPLKTANFRAVSRARAACTEDPLCPSQTPEFYNFSRILLKVPDHTWGVDVKKTLHDFVNYSNPDFYACLPAQLQPAGWDALAAQQGGQIRQAPVPGSRTDRETAPCPNYEDCIVSWERQAAYIDWALEALPAAHPVVKTYTADVQHRKQLASISRSSLLAAGASLSHVTDAGLGTGSSTAVRANNAPYASRRSSTATARVIDAPASGRSIPAPAGANSNMTKIPMRHSSTSSAHYDRQTATGAHTVDDASSARRDSLHHLELNPANIARPLRHSSHAGAQPDATTATSPARRGLMVATDADTVAAAIAIRHSTAAAARADSVHVAAPSLGHASHTLAGQDTTAGGVAAPSDSLTMAVEDSAGAGGAPYTSTTAPSPLGGQMKHTSKITGRDDATGSGEVSSASREGNIISGEVDDSSGEVTSTRDAGVPNKDLDGREYRCGNWKLEVDPVQGGLTSLIKLHGQDMKPGTDWARGTAVPSSHRGTRTRSKSGRLSDCSHEQGCPSSSPGPGVLGRLMYHAYCEASYEFVADHYSWVFPLPWWYPLDFFKVNSSSTWNQEVEAMAELEETYERHSPDGSLEQLALRYSLPHNLVKNHGAPSAMWTIIGCPASAADDLLDVSVVWQGKPPTRLPEALWFSFVPHSTAIDPNSWRLHKLNSDINPLEVVVNGSMSMHAVSDAGVSVHSADGRERLQISTLDASLVSPGKPTAFPNGVYPPCMATDGVHFNLENNVWSTNYVMWVPYTTQDVDMAFRFRIHASRLESSAQHQVV